MKLNTLNLLFLLYVIVLVLMSIKYLFTKNKLSNTDIVIHLLVIVVLGLLVAYTNKRESFLNPASIENSINPLKEIKCDGTPIIDSKAHDFANAHANENQMLIGQVRGNYETKPYDENKENEIVVGDYGKMGAAINYNMGPYSGVVIDAAEHQDRRRLIPGLNSKLRIGHDKEDCGRLGSPCDVGLFENPHYTDPMGEESALNLKYKSGPSVDGTDKTPNSMFMFSHNKCSPGCCPSTYSCDHGCVCTTTNQRNFIRNSGVSRK